MTVKITVTTNHRENVWGFTDLLKECKHLSEAEQKAAIVQLCQEDVLGLLEGATWEVEITKQEQGDAE